ncbi:DUF1059 domain-containing protein [Halolamina rubra]|uniref:DUF1059 domain-containing protein n=1 Tax=Halolamina rubra TaxID=1380430 RepID=UPI0009E19CDF|nr:DUF1059 domain-containing protein [Halolamina rubra]
MAYQYECSDCAFMVRSDDDDELIEHVQQHADGAHGMQVAPDDVRAGWESVEMGAQD